MSSIFFFMIVICYTGLPHARCFLVNPIIYMRKAIWHSSFPSATHHPIYILTISDLLMVSALSTSPLHWRPRSLPPLWIHLESRVSMERKSSNKSSQARGLRVLRSNNPPAPRWGHLTVLKHFTWDSSARSALQLLPKPGTWGNVGKCHVCVYNPSISYIQHGSVVRGW